MRTNDFTIGQIRSITWPSCANIFNSFARIGTPIGSIIIIITGTTISIGSRVHSSCPGSTNGSVIKGVNSVGHGGVRLQVVPGFANYLIGSPIAGYGRINLTGKGNFLFGNIHLVILLNGFVPGFWSILANLSNPNTYKPKCDCKK